MPTFDLQVRLGTAPARRITLSSASLLVGRSRAAQVRLPSPEVSGAHARLLARDGALWVEDLGSANGTRIGARPLAPGRPERLGPDEVLHVGPYTLQVRLQPGAPRQSEAPREQPAGESNPAPPGSGAGPSATPPDGRAAGLPEGMGMGVGMEESTAALALGLVRDLLCEPAAPPVTLHVRTPGGLERTWHLGVGQVLRIGRDPRCDVAVDDPDLSREHAEVCLGELGVTVTDLGSKNGVFRGDERLCGPTPWPDGVVLQMGGTTLWVDDPAEAWIRKLDAACEGEGAGEAEAAGGDEAAGEVEGAGEGEGAGGAEAVAEAAVGADAAGPAAAAADGAAPDPAAGPARGKPAGPGRWGFAVGLLVLGLLMAGALWALWVLLWG